MEALQVERHFPDLNTPQFARHGDCSVQGLMRLFRRFANVELVFERYALFAHKIVYGGSTDQLSNEFEFYKRLKGYAVRWRRQNVFEVSQSVSFLDKSVPSKACFPDSQKSSHFSKFESFADLPRS